MTDLTDIQNYLTTLLRSYQPSLRVTIDTTEKFEVTGTIPTMQGKKKVDGFYFASVVRKPKDVRFYFFPIYTHEQALHPLSTDLKKALKGKSCFHIKKMDDAFQNNLKELIQKSVALYRKDGLLS